MPPEPLQSQNGGSRTPIRNMNHPGFETNSRPIETRNSSQIQSSSNKSCSEAFDVGNWNVQDNFRGGRTDNSRTLNQASNRNYDSRNVRFQCGISNDRNYRNNETPLRARAEQLEIKNQSAIHSERGTGMGTGNRESEQLSSASNPQSHSAPTASNQSRRGRSDSGIDGRSGRYSGMNSGGYGGMNGGYGGYGGGGMYGMGGMEMGMGMGMGMGSHMMMGPFSWIYSLNNIVHSIPMMMDVLGMNSQMLYQMFSQTYKLLMTVVTLIKRSEFRRFLQHKSRRSKALRFMFIVGAMGIASQMIRIAKLIAVHHFSQRRRLRNL
jgi:hypothetical protein